MDSQDPDQFTYSQNHSNDTEQYRPTIESRFNPFLQPDQFSNQSTPLNLQFQPNFSFNPISIPYASHVQQQFGAGFSFQGLMNAPNFPFESQTSNSSKGSKKKKNEKALKNSQTPEHVAYRRNWTIDEDIALTKAWLSIFVDPIVGTGQKCDKLWNRIFNTWRENMGEYDRTRNITGLSCHWGAIHSAVTKFHGLYEALERHPRSGTTPENMKREAMQMYKDLNDGQLFKFEHCWEIMKKNLKWCSRYLTLAQAPKKQKPVDGSSVDTPPPSTPTTPGSSFSRGDDSINLDTLVTEVNNFDGVLSPPGRKASKEKKKRMHEEKDVIDILSHLQCTIERQFNFTREELELKKERDKKEYEFREQTLKMEMEFKERGQKMKEEAQKRKEKAEKRKEQERILNQDLTKLQPVLREAVERMQAEILKEWERDGLFGEVSTSDGMDL